MAPKQVTPQDRISDISRSRCGRLKISEGTMRIAITGSTGYLGTALSQALPRDGHEIIPVVRGNSQDPDSVWNPSLGWIRPGALNDVDAVIHLAGENIGKRWTAQRRQELMTSRREATKLLVNHLQGLDSPPKIFISASAVGIYGDRGEELLSEDSELGESPLADICTAWESAADEASSSMRVVKLRLSPIFGEGAEVLDRLSLPIKLFAGGPVGNGRQWMPWIHVSDVVKIISMAMSDENYSGVYNLVAPDAVRNKDLVKTIGKILGRPTLFPPTPKLPLRIALGEMVDWLIFASQRVQPMRLEQMGYEWEQPLLEGALRESFGK